jgi:hypothetical protein
MSTSLGFDFCYGLLPAVFWYTNTRRMDRPSASFVCTRKDIIICALLHAGSTWRVKKETKREARRSDTHRAKLVAQFGRLSSFRNAKICHDATHAL